jgi:hypothetical protein
MVSTWLLIAAACFAATGFGAYIAVWACRRLMDKQQQQVDERLAQLQTQLNTVSRGAIGVGKRLIEAEQRLAAALQRQNTLESTIESSLESRNQPTASPSELIPYTLAERMLEQGATADSLIRQCGLSQAEAELMALVHAQGGSAANASSNVKPPQKKPQGHTAAV